jgi:NAD(P)-dependent dehydrogenase (short-subunit alcohol dehydrogenase family)
VSNFLKEYQIFLKINRYSSERTIKEYSRDIIKFGQFLNIDLNNEEALKKTVQKFATPNVAYLVWDIAEGKEKEHFNEAESVFGRIDILVNNAGVTSNTKIRYSFEDMDDAHYHYVHDINALATRRMCMEFSNRSQEGTILNIISNTGVLPALDAYFTSKWALYSFTKAFADEMANKESSVTINGLCPGPIMSDMTPEESYYRKEIPNHRIGIPEEIAELAFVQVYSGLCGQNGEITLCDGGQIYR